MRKNGSLARQEREILAGDYRIIRGPVLDQVVVELPWVDQTLQRGNVGNTICSWRYRMNSAYDPDPLVFTGAVSGIDSWSVQYKTYRVLAFKYDITIMNEEAFPLIVTCCPTQTDIGVNSIQAPNFGEVKYGQLKPLSAKGGLDQARMRGQINMAAFFGTNYLWASDFNADINGNPLHPIYFNVGLESPVPQVNGVVVSARLTYVTALYNRQSPFA